METETNIALEKITLHNWIIANRTTYHLFSIKVVAPYQAEFSSLQVSINILIEQRNKAIETYLYLTDAGAEGDTGTILDYILQVNDHLKKLLCL